MSEEPDKLPEWTLYGLVLGAAAVVFLLSTCRIGEVIHR